MIPPVLASACSRRAFMAGAAMAPWAVGAANLPDLIERYKRSVVLVGTFSPTDNPRFGFKGTGFAMGNGRQIVTCAHVINEVPVEGGRQWVVRCLAADGSWLSYSTQLHALDRPHDLAVLTLDGPALPTLPMGPATLPREGTEIALMGFPLGGLLGFSHVTHRGIVSAHTQAAEPASTARQLNEASIAFLKRGAFELLQLDAVALPGNSGGPVFNSESGEVVGVLNMSLIRNTKEGLLPNSSGISYAVPIHHVVPLLRTEATQR